MKYEDVHKTAFVINNGHYEFLRMPSKTFQRAMNTLLVKYSFVKCFLDDVLIHSETLTEHKEHLKIILELFQKSKIKINFLKSNFLKTEVEYLGNIINKEGIKCSTKQFNQLDTIPAPPKNK